MRSESTKSRAKTFCCSAMLVLLAGCVSMVAPHQVHRAASVVDYLYPNAAASPQLEPATTTLRPPVRVGLAFVPGGQWDSGISEQAKTQLLERVKAAFAEYSYIGTIEVIPSNYLQKGGGFENLEQVGRLFNVEIVALLSYDQVQFNDNNALAVLYWTIVGAYVIHGDRYDVQTLVDASVFDIASRKLLFRAPGSSRIKGTASMANFSARSRAGQAAGYDQAVDELIPQLQKSLEEFKQRSKHDVLVKIQDKEGYRGGGDVGWLGVLLVATLTAMLHATRARA